MAFRIAVFALFLSPPKHAPSGNRPIQPFLLCFSMGGPPFKMDAEWPVALFRRRVRPELNFLLVSPVFARELVTAPRRIKHYVARGVYVAALLMLMGPGRQPDHSQLRRSCTLRIDALSDPGAAAIGGRNFLFRPIYGEQRKPRERS